MDSLWVLFKSMPAITVTKYTIPKSSYQGLATAQRAARANSETVYAFKKINIISQSLITAWGLMQIFINEPKWHISNWRGETEYFITILILRQNFR